MHGQGRPEIARVLQAVAAFAIRHSCFSRYLVTPTSTVIQVKMFTAYQQHHREHPQQSTPPIPTQVVPLPVPAVVLAEQCYAASQQCYLRAIGLKLVVKVNVSQVEPKAAHILHACSCMLTVNLTHNHSILQH